MKLRDFGRFFKPARPVFVRRSAQSGVSLLLALLFVALFGGALASIAAFNAYKVRENEAKVTGRETVEIAKAARLYVRDRMVADPNLRTVASVPQLISLATLKSAGYLSDSFGRISGADTLSAMNQQIYVIMTNWPVGGDPADDATVPTAFIYLRDSEKSNPQLMIRAIEVARRQNSSISAPIFNAVGNNISSDCRGAGPAVALWDTGCLTDTEFTTLVATVPSPPSDFEAGSLMVPAWKVVQPDLRAVMRFPQPENAGYATMLTDLNMGRCATPAAEVQATGSNALGNNAYTATGLCTVDSDTATENNRFNISGIRNMALQRVIAEPQEDEDFGGEDPDIGTANEDSMRITGDLLLDNDLRIFNRVDMPSPAANAARPLDEQLTHRMDIPNGTAVVERNVYLYSHNLTRRGVATIGNITEARKLVSNSLETPNFNSTEASTFLPSPDGDPVMDVTEHTIITGDTTTTGATGEIITQTFNADIARDGGGIAILDDPGTPLSEARSGAAMLATDLTGEVQVTGTLDTHTGPINVDGADPLVATDINGVAHNYAAVIGEISTADTLFVTNAVSGSTSASTIISDNVRGYGNTILPEIDALDVCKSNPNIANGCPYRQYLPPGITP